MKDIFHIFIHLTYAFRVVTWALVGKGHFGIGAEDLMLEYSS